MTSFKPLTPERRRAMTRDHLLEAAAMVFARDGLQGSSLDEIATTAGFTKGAVYSNFKSKDDLFLAVLEQRFERGHAAIRGAMDPPEGRSPDAWMPRITKAVRESMWDDRWTMLFLEFVLYAARNPRARSKLAAYVRRSLDRVEELLTQEYEAAGTPPRYPPEDFALVSEALFDGLAVYRLIDESFTNDQRLQTVLQMLSDAVDIDETTTST